MQRDIPYNEYILEVNESLTSGGIFLNTKDEKVNSMVIGWGGVTTFWGKPIFIVPVRQSRYTHKQLQNTGEFTISVPLDDSLQKALDFCGTKSGRDYDKLKECGITALDPKVIKTPIIGECKLHYECKVVYQQDLIPENLIEEIDKRWYPDYHTLFFGEILACYTI
ncbi:MAG: flavin reductase family protein [Clostridiales bacterium]|nr:flavin reductase family protein [Clostridiales bacterium]